MPHTRFRACLHGYTDSFGTQLRLRTLGNTVASKCQNVDFVVGRFEAAAAAAIDIEAGDGCMRNDVFHCKCSLISCRVNLVRFGT